MATEQPCALVTGATGGIGWAVTQDLREHGWSVAVADVAGAPTTERVGDDPSLLAVTLDVTSGESVEAGVAATLESFGRLDLLVNNAGIGRLHALEDMPPEEWRLVLDVDLDGAFRCMQVAGRHMLAAGGGSIVNISSIYANLGGHKRAAYTAAKAGLLGLTRTAAVEWADRGIRVNAVGPGYVRTPTLERMAAAGEVDLDPIIARVPLGRLAVPEDIARAVRFLGSDEASYITGQVLFVDGGLLVEPGFG
jgi:3-oxoacyl-[acyl-carrier protein] reductase